MFEVRKIDPVNRWVFGWASVSIDKQGKPLVDSQDDHIPIDELERAVYGYNLEFRDMNDMHAGPAVGRLIESIVITKDKLSAMGLPEGLLPLGWWAGWFIEDSAVFARVKAGDRAMLSIEGTGIREEVR